MPRAAGLVGLNILHMCSSYLASSCEMLSGLNFYVLFIYDYIWGKKAIFLTY